MTNPRAAVDPIMPSSPGRSATGLSTGKALAPSAAIPPQMCVRVLKKSYSIAAASTYPMSMIERLSA